TTTTQAQSDEPDEVDWGKVLDDAYNDVVPESTPEEPSLAPELQAMLDQALQEMEALNANAPQAPQQVGRKLLETLNPLIQKNMAEMMRGMFIQQLLFCRQDPVVFRARIVMGAQVCSALSKGEQPDDPMVKQLQALGISPDNLPNTQQGLTQLKANLTNVLQILEMPA